MPCKHTLKLKMSQFESDSKVRDGELVRPHCSSMQRVRRTDVFLKVLCEFLITIQCESKHAVILSDIRIEIELCFTDEFCFKFGQTLNTTG